MNAEQEKLNAMKFLVTSGAVNSAERRYAMACEKLRQEHNAGKGYYQAKLRGKYRG